MKLIKILLVIVVLLFTEAELTSQYVGFGRNKVQYNNFDWHTISTEHFKVYFYPEMRELAEIGAAYAEETYRIHQQNFNYSLIDTVPIIFYATPTHFRETNTTSGLIPDGVGGFFEFIKGRVVIPFDGSLGNFKHVIRHELTHVFMTAKVGNILKLHKQSTDRFPPLWFTEGLAEYLSTEWDPTAEMILKDAVLNKYMAGLDNWEKFYGSFMMYKMGQCALMHMAEKYGPEKVVELVDNFWMSDDFSVVMKKTIGKDYEAFDKIWLEDLDRKYTSQIVIEDNPSRNTTSIYSSGFGHKPAYWNYGNKEEIFFIGNETGYTCVFKVNLKHRKHIVTVIKGENSEDFEEFHYFRTGLDISGKGILAFATKSGASDALHLYDVKEDEIIASYNFDNIVQIGAPSFFTDGNKLVFAAMDIGGKSDLYIFDIKSKSLTRLTNDYYDDRDADISPDGKTIVFSSDRTSYGYNNRYNLFLYNIADNSISYLTSGDQVDYSPQYSPDGGKILFTSTIGGVQNIWIKDLERNSTTEVNDTAGGTSKIEKLTNYTTAAFDPKWAGDDRIVFTSFENRKLSVRLINHADKLIDTPKSTQSITFERIKNLWKYDKIISSSKKNELRYQKDYTLDLATSTISADPVFGTTAGGIIAMSDLLGNDQFYFLIYNNSESTEEFFKSFNIAISRVSLGQRLNYAYGIFHLSGRKYDYGDSFSYLERTFGGYFALSYPLSFFRRLEASVSIETSKRSLTEENKINRRALLLTNSLSYTLDNTIWGTIGPMEGNRFNFTVGLTTDIQYGNVNYYTVIFDYRKYLRIFNDVALATRLEFLINQGKESSRWAIGGSWDLRGWPRFGIRGKKAWVGSTELRFPIFNVANLNLPLGVNYIFPYLRGAVYFDAGNAWDTQYEGTLGSIGFGLRLNLLYIMTLRYDIGKRIEKNMTQFQRGLFQQFFFGWDF